MGIKDHMQDFSEESRGYHLGDQKPWYKTPTFYNVAGAVVGSLIVAGIAIGIGYKMGCAMDEPEDQRREGEARELLGIQKEKELDEIRGDL